MPTYTYTYIIIINAENKHIWYSPNTTLGNAEELLMSSSECNIPNPNGHFRSTNNAP